MRTRTWLVLLLALASGAIAGYAALQLVSDRPAPLQAEEPRSAFQIVIAARDLSVGQLIGEEDVRLIDWPGNAVPEGFATTISDVIGRGLIRPVTTNEPIIASKLADRGTGAGLPILVPDGMRAVSMPVDEVVTVAGYVEPGTRVDIMVTMQPPGGGEMITKTFLQNIEVASAGAVIQPDEDGQPTSVTLITLFVTPDQAEQITLARTMGTVQFALRNTLDNKEARTQGARPSRLLTLGSARSTSAGTRRAAPAPVQETGTTLEIIKGGNRAVIRFGSGRQES